jgi:hypothetical protein
MSCKQITCKNLYDYSVTLSEIKGAFSNMLVLFVLLVFQILEMILAS